MSGSVWVCNLWSARLWECNAHDWLKGCVVGPNGFHLHVSPMMSHAQSSSSSCLHMSVPSLSSCSSTSSTPQTTLPINKSPVHPQNEECCLVANTTSSTLCVCVVCVVCVLCVLCCVLCCVALYCFVCVFCVVCIVCVVCGVCCVIGVFGVVFRWLCVVCCVCVVLCCVVLWCGVVWCGVVCCVLCCVLCVVCCVLCWVWCVCVCCVCCVCCEFCEWCVCNVVLCCFRLCCVFYVLCCVWCVLGVILCVWCVLCVVVCVVCFVLCSVDCVFCVCCVFVVWCVVCCVVYCVLSCFVLSCLCCVLCLCVVVTLSTPCLMRSRCGSRLAWPLPHTPLALQIFHPHCSFHMEMTIATIHNTLRLSAHWLNRNYLQGMSPTISLKWTIQRWHRYSSTDRAWRLFMILLRALRLFLLNRIGMMSKYGICWLHPCTNRSEKQVPTDHEFITLTEKTPCKFISFPSRCGEFAAVFSCKTKSSQESHSDRNGVPLHIESSRRKWSLITLSESENDKILIVEEQRDHLLSEARSEVLKQECRADFLDCSMRELQRQIHSSRTETDHTNLGYETSRREQARLHEELAKRERALRETHIWSIHEVEVLKRAQEMRIDEFSRQELRESLPTFHELTSQIQELQDMVNLVNESGEFQDVESICSGKLSHVPSQPAAVPSPCGMLNRDQSLRLDAWNLLGTSGNVFGSPLVPIDSSSTLYRGRLHSWNLNATDGNLVRDSTGRLIAGSEERNKDTVPMPIFARRPSTMNYLFPAEGAYPQNYMADQQKLQISELQFDKFPTPSTFSCWKMRFKTQVSACSGSPSEAMLWITEVEMVDSVDDLKSPRSTQGYTHFPNFEMLDARIASALNRII